MIRRASLLTVAVSACLLGGAVSAQAGGFGPARTSHEASEPEDLVGISEVSAWSTPAAG